MQRIATTLSLLMATASLTLVGCYVVPLGPDGRPLQQPTTVIVQPPPNGQAAMATTASVITARLYPANELAAGTGIIAGSVTTSSNGKGVFSIPYNGETLTGEATKTSDGIKHSGIANASSPRGTFVTCRYTMNSASQGTGQCVFSDKSAFQLHLGN